MKERGVNYRSVATLGVAIVLALLGGAPASAADAPPAEWTVLVFMNAKNNLEPDAVTNFAQMAKVGSTDKLNLVVELGRPNHPYRDGGTPQGWSGVRRFKVNLNDQIDRAPEKDLGDTGPITDMGDPRSLVDFLNWGFDNYKAKHYLLVIWNHGQGWRFQMANSRALRLSATNRSQPVFALINANAAKLPPVTGGFRSVSSDEDTGHILYNRQIQDSLLKLRNQGKKLDIIAFDACLMGMLETAYALRDVATYMVASEELDPGEGFQYKTWLDPLKSQPTMMPSDLATELVTAFQSTYQDNGQQTTLSSVSLGLVPAAAQALGKFSDALTAKLDSQRATLASARRKMFAFGSWYGVKGNGSIDLQTFLSQFASLTADPALKALAINAQKAVQATITRNYASEEEKRYTATGLAFYMPPTAADFMADPDSSGYLKSNTLHPVQFVQDYNWATVVAQYLHVGP
jgi:hypothetical protein